jgi:hypothetical protein
LQKKLGEADVGKKDSITGVGLRVNDEQKAEKIADQETLHLKRRRRYFCD